LYPTSPIEVLNCVNNLTTSSAGIDDIHPKVVKAVSHIVSPVLSHIINLSFITGVVPADLKAARVTPIFKSGDPKSKGNYRPISVLNCFSKIFEKLMFNRLFDYFSKYNLFFSSQYGFLPGRSTSHALLHFTNNILSAFEGKQIACGIFLDLSKAFDTLDHNILVNKLQHYGIRGTALAWFSNYLSNRKQCVNVNGNSSEFLNITTGVPQGSILGPLLFIIYVNDLYRCTDNFTFTLYADDTNILCIGKHPDQVIATVNHEMPKVINWFKSNRLHLNKKKTIAVLFRPIQKQIDDASLHISIDMQTINFSNCVKFLGVTIDTNLSWSVHINNIVSKLSKGVGVISRLRHTLPTNLLIKIYYILIMPYLTYCCVIWGNSALTHLKKLLLFRKSAFVLLLNPILLPTLNRSIIN